jgi:hypothetical protein
MRWQVETMTSGFLCGILVAEGGPMDNNKVNSWMISTAVLALVVGFLIGCDSPRQQVSAQTSSGVTASELDFITGKYNGIPDSLSAALIGYGAGNGVPGFLYTDVLTVPPGKIFVATSIHGAFMTAEHYRNSSQWLGKNYDPAIRSTDRCLPWYRSQLFRLGPIGFRRASSWI